MALRQKSQDQSSTSQVEHMTMATSLQELQEFIVSALRKHDETIKEMLEQKYDKLSQDILTLATGLSAAVLQIDKEVTELSSELDFKTREADLKITNLDNKTQRIEEELMMLQFKSRELAIRLRGMKEENGENLRRVCADVLAVLLMVSPAEVLCKMDKAYRVNSWVAKERQLPRDVVIYFTDRRIRNDILNKSFVSPIQIDGREIVIYKELPPKMLRERKNYAFLTTELKKQQIRFRWDVPVGIVLRFQGRRYQLNTLEKADEFYSNILKIGSTSLSEASVIADEEKQMEKSEDRMKQMDPYLKAKPENKQSLEQRQQMFQPARDKGVKGKSQRTRKRGKK